MKHILRFLDWVRGIKPKPEPKKPWYTDAHVGNCPFCGCFAWLPEDVEKGSNILVKCGRQKDGSQLPGHGCGRDLFA